MRSIRVDEHVRLRDPLAADAAALFNLVEANRTRLARWLPWVPQIRAVQDETDWIASRHLPGASETELALLIVDRGEIVGGLGIGGLGHSAKKGEIGYWISQQAEGKGIVTRACRAALKYAFETRSMNRMQIRAAIDNGRSRAIPERLGFQLEGIERAGALVQGRFQDLAVYSMLASEWKALRSDGGPTG